MSDTKTKTKALKQSDYTWGSGQLNLTKLTDDAVAALENIHHNGVGRQRKRSRGVVIRSMRAIMMKAGYTETQASVHWRDQVLSIFNLNINAEE